MAEGLKSLHKLSYVDHKTYPTLEAAVDRSVVGVVKTLLEQVLVSHIDG